MLLKTPPFVVCLGLVALTALPFVARHAKPAYRAYFDDRSSPSVEQRESPSAGHLSSSRQYEWSCDRH